MVGGKSVEFSFCFSSTKMQINVLRLSFMHFLPRLPHSSEATQIIKSTFCLGLQNLAFEKNSMKSCVDCM